MSKKILGAGFIGLIILHFCSCVTMDKARQKFDQNQQEAAEYCAAKFAPLNSVEVLPGETTFDTIYVPVDVNIPVECPPSEKGVVIKWKYRDTGRTVIVNKTDTVRVTTVNTAAVEAEKLAKVEAQKEVKEWKGKAEKRGSLNLWLIIALVCCGAWITRKLWLPTIAKLFT